MKSGYIAIIGQPNVGKSTLLNRLIGSKLAGISPKPQTTRAVIHGILTRHDCQIVFLDTPGHHKPFDRLGEWMIKEIRKSLDLADLIYWMTLPGAEFEKDRKIFELVKAAKKPVFLLINQVDDYSKEEILPVIKTYHEHFPFKEIIPISAKTGEQLDVLLKKTASALPEGTKVFPDDLISDQQERLFVEEIVREKIYRFTSQEIPYASTVAVESFKESEQEVIVIKAVITVEKASQKPILIGAKGAKLKQIGKAARQDIESFLGQKVFLQLWVKVVPDWKDKEQLLNRLGYQ